jgi:hypothetical protein
VAGNVSHDSAIMWMSELMDGLAPFETELQRLLEADVRNLAAAAATSAGPSRGPRRSWPNEGSECSYPVDSDNTTAAKLPAVGR